MMSECSICFNEVIKLDCRKLNWIFFYRLVNCNLSAEFFSIAELCFCWCFMTLPYCLSTVMHLYCSSRSGKPVHKFHGWLSERCIGKGGWGYLFITTSGPQPPILPPSSQSARPHRSWCQWSGFLEGLCLYLEQECRKCENNQCGSGGAFRAPGVTKGFHPARAEKLLGGSLQRWPCMENSTLIWVSVPGQTVQLHNLTQSEKWGCKVSGM